MLGDSHGDNELVDRLLAKEGGDELAAAQRSKRDPIQVVI